MKTPLRDAIVKGIDTVSYTHLDVYKRQIKESVRAKLKVIIKRTLRQYGYPPDMQKLATETVLKQAELIANELTNG